MDKYTILNQLGSGSYGAAHLAIHHDTQSKFVLKEIKISHLNEHDLENAKKEVKVLSSLIHDHITKFEESFENGGLLYIVMEYCAAGDLQNLIANRKEIYFPEDRILDWFTQLCLAVKFIHDRHIIHRDIKTQNVFLSEEGKIKLGDFGIAKMLDKTNDLTNTCVGTPYYLSPEMCENKPYSNKSDVWAVGCVLHEMASLKHAFDAPNLKALLVKIVKCSYKGLPPRYSRDLQKLIKEIFQRDPKSRPSITAILRSKPLLKRLPRFLTDKDPDQLLLKTATKKQMRSVSLGRLPIHKRMGLTDPSSKYGISPALKRYALKSSNPLFSASKSNAKKKQGTTKFKGAFITKRTNPSHSQRLRLGNLNTQTQKKRKSITKSSPRDRKPPSKNAKVSTPTKVQLVLENGDFKSVELSSSILNNLGDVKVSLQESHGHQLLYDMFLTKNFTHFNPGLKSSQEACVDHDQNYGFGNYQLKKDLFDRVFDIVDREVSQVSQNALEKREASYCNTLDSLHLCHVSRASYAARYSEESKDIVLCEKNIVCLNDIRVNVLPLGKTYVIKSRKYKTAGDHARYSDGRLGFSTPAKGIYPVCKKWQCPATPIFSNFPLETTASQMDCTSSSDLVVVYNERKRWEKRASDIVDILASAELSSGNASLNSLGKSIVYSHDARLPIQASRVNDKSSHINKFKCRSRLNKVSRKSSSFNLPRFTNERSSSKMFQSLPTEYVEGLLNIEALSMSPTSKVCDDVKNGSFQEESNRIERVNLGNIDNACDSRYDPVSPSHSITNEPKSLGLIHHSAVECVDAITLEPELDSATICTRHRPNDSNNEALKRTYAIEGQYNCPDCLPPELISIAKHLSVQVNASIIRNNATPLKLSSEPSSNYRMIADSDKIESSAEISNAKIVLESSTGNDSISKTDSSICKMTSDASANALEQDFLSPDWSVEPPMAASDPLHLSKSCDMDDKKSRRGLFKFFHKSMNSNNIHNSPLVKDEKSLSSYSPLSKTKSRFSGILKRFMSPKQHRNKSENCSNIPPEPLESCALTKTDLSKKERKKITGHLPLTEKTLNDNSFYPEVCSIDNPGVELDTAADSGIHSCFSDLASSNSYSSYLKIEDTLNTSNSSISNTCIERNLNSDTDDEPTSDIAMADDKQNVITAKQLEVEDGVRKAAINLVESILHSAANQLEERCLSCKSCDPVSPSHVKVTIKEEPRLANSNLYGTEDARQGRERNNEWQKMELMPSTIEIDNNEWQKMELMPSTIEMDNNEWQKMELMPSTIEMDNNGNTKVEGNVKDIKYNNDSENVIHIDNNTKVFSEPKCDRVGICDLANLESLLIYTAVTPPYDPTTCMKRKHFSNSSNSMISEEAQNISAFRNSLEDLLTPEKHYKYRPQSSKYWSSDNHEPPDDIFGWIEAQKEALEGMLGLELFLECYWCLEAAFDRGNSSLIKAMEKVKAKLGSDREFLAEDIIHIIGSELVYSS